MSVLEAAGVEALARALGMAGIAVENVSSMGNAEQWLPDAETAGKVLAALSPADRLAIAGITEDRLARTLHDLGFDLRTRRTDQTPFAANAGNRLADARAILAALETP